MPSFHPLFHPPAALGICVRKIPVASAHPLDPPCFHSNEGPRLHQLVKSAPSSSHLLIPRGAEQAE